ncbi:CHAT domain-containing protein [Argonema antarcticum]|uniref:CHAT domain-containing protein n=1 Tax=Argonema antarcticum TaxID=2942763 RepID=UPI002013A09F|nr:CHAT domain-containing protein [Argonema antarcticum]MCL1474881.1 CHAT domain-containing protein [Argonema antarcticum A004/B2]
MAKTYYTYRIRVANRDRVQVEKWDAQHQDKGQPRGALRYQEKLPEIAPLLEAAKNNELNDSNLVRSLGEALFDVLFDDVLRQDFVNFYYQVVQQEKQLLRVELDIDEQGMPEIAALPWEFMCVPARANLGTIWMGTLPDLVFSRRRSQWIAAQPIQLAPDEKLRIALVISAPPNLPPVAYEPVQAALEKLAVEQAKRVELLPIVSSANPEAIDTILSKDPHIFHFIGHGRMQNEGKQEVGEIALVDPDFNEAMWVDADYFSELFNQHRPGVVMLQACEGGMLSSSQAFVGVASKVVQQNVPVVVAMQYEVTNSTASRFALRFYQQLAAEDPVDIAVQYGRRAIALGSMQYGKRDFATPVIFMRVQDGYLFKRQSMTKNSNPNYIIQRILNGTQTDYDVEALRQWLNSGAIQNLQVGKYNVNIGQGQDIHIGDRTYQGLDAQAIREVARSVLRGANATDIQEIVRSILKEEFHDLAQRENPQSSLPKTILVLASSPTNQARLRLDKEVREIDEGLRRSQQREKFTLQQRWAVRPDDLRRALLDLSPQIIHFCGHGSGEDGLVLEDDAGRAQLVPTEALVNLFKRFATRGLECVVLNACYSEIQADAIAAHIDYIVGMNSKIGDNAAIKFAVGFYDELGAGYSYEDAYHGGCDAIALQGIPEEHTPVFKNFKKKSN